MPLIFKKNYFHIYICGNKSMSSNFDKKEMKKEMKRFIKKFNHIYSKYNVRIEDSSEDSSDESVKSNQTDKDIP